MSFFSKKSKSAPSHSAKIPPVGAFGHYNKKKGVKNTDPSSVEASLQEAEIQISVENVTLSFEGRAVLQDISFDIRSGDYICIIGENGSGKSTLMNAILGLLKPSGGKIKYHKIARNQIGVLPQLSPIDTDFPATVREVVLAGCIARSSKGIFLSKDSKDIAFSAMEKLGITPLADRSFRELSGGQKQRVMLARALCAAEKMMFLDEPVTGLDRTSIADVYALIDTLNRDGMTIVTVTHDVRSALRYASKILRINKDSYLFLDTEEYKKLPEAQIYLQSQSDGVDRDQPYGEGGFRYTGN